VALASVSSVARPVLLTDRRTDGRQLTTFAYFLLTQQCSWLSVTQQKQRKQTSCANIIINRLFNNSSTKSSIVALLEPKLILITITLWHNFITNTVSSKTLLCVCFAIVCQMHTLSNGFRRVGHKDWIFVTNLCEVKTVGLSRLTFQHGCSAYRVEFCRLSMKWQLCVWVWRQSGNEVILGTV